MHTSLFFLFHLYLMLQTNQLHLGLVIQLVFSPPWFSLLVELLFVLSCFYPPFWWHFWVCYTDLIYIFTIPLHTWCSMFHNFTSDQQFTSYKILSLLFPMMITIHQRNRNVSNDDDTFSKSAHNSLPWVLPDKYITDQLTIPLILSLLALFSLFLPSTNMSLSEKCNVLFSLMTNNSSMNRIFNSKSTYVQISRDKYTPLLCQIWPDFIQKSSLFYQQSLGMIQTRVPNSQFSLLIRSELQFS